MLEKRFMQQLNSRPNIPVAEVADSLLIDIENLFSGAICSILKLSADNSLFHYSAPNLPAAYIEAINGVKAGPQEGSCGTAVFFNRTIIVPDISLDILWENYKELALSFGLQSCWSVPIRYSSGGLFGTFGIYHREVNIPSDNMLATIERLANFIGLVIENREMIDDLRLSTERYDLSSKATHDMIWDWDLQKNEIFRNEMGLRNIYGFAANEPIRLIDDWVNRIHPEDRQQVKQEIDAIHLGKEASRFEVEYRFLRGDEKYVYIFDRGFIMRDHNGNAIRVIGAAQDITDRVNSQQLLRDSEERYRSLFHSNPISMWIYDVETLRFLEVNQMAVRHYGYTSTEFAGMTIHDLRPSGEEEQRHLQRLLDKDEERAYLQGKWQHRKKNGELIYVELLSHQLNYKGREAMLVLANDVTQTILLQDQLMEEKTNRQTEIVKVTIAVQEKERNEIGHELHDNVNQILTSAKLYFECVGLYDERKEEYRTTGIGLILEAIEEIRRLSKSMAPPRLHDIGLIKSIEDLLGNLVNVSDMRIDFSHDDIDEEVIDDGLKLTIYRIVQEQITNVVKHADASQLAIRLRRENDELLFSIHDNGQGYDPVTRGKGIGISNIINRSALHQGKVEIISAPGEGFTLQVRFLIGARE